jgi:hypothetical protein
MSGKEFVGLHGCGILLFLIRNILLNAIRDIPSFEIQEAPRRSIRSTKKTAERERMRLCPFSPTPFPSTVALPKSLRVGALALFTGVGLG